MKFLRLLKTFRQPKPNEIQKNAKSGGPEELAKYLPLGDTKVMLAISKGINYSRAISKVYSPFAVLESMIFLEMNGYIEKIKTIYGGGRKRKLYGLTKKGKEILEAGLKTRKFQKLLKEMKLPAEE